MFDEEVDNVLEVTIAGEVGRKVKAMATLIYNMGSERFGFEKEEYKKKRKKPRGLEENFDA